MEAIVLLSDMDPDPTPESILCCDSTVGTYKHSDSEKKGMNERREIKDRMTRSGFNPIQARLFWSCCGQRVHCAPF